MRRTMLKMGLAVLLAGQIAVAAAADEVFATAEGAIRGYDVVAYHQDGKAVKGASGITLNWNGAEWHFASEANRAAFQTDPDRYAPKYGGFCAYGTASGYKVGTDPNAFAVVDGKLYLNYNAAVQKTWQGDRAHFIDVANQNWQSLEHEAYEAPAAASGADKGKSESN